MSLKQILLATLTAIVVFLVSAELLSSLTEPQVQGQINLYQTNLVLQASQWQQWPQSAPADKFLGPDPQAEAITVYQKIIQSLTKLPDLTPPQQQQLRQAQLQLGILYATASQADAVTQARQSWQAVINSGPNSEAKLAEILRQLWQTPPISPPAPPAEITTQLQGWFRSQALKQFWTIKNNPAELANLTTQMQAAAQAALIRLGLIALMPLIGSVIGIGLLIIWGVQQYRQRQVQVAQLEITIPWTADTTLAVMVSWFTAFFGISFILMPLLLQLVGGRGIMTTPLAQALYALITYGLMMAAGFGILIYNWRRFGKPVGHWLSFSPKKWWWAWSLAGYFVALPLVLLTSLLSQQLLHNQGGGNPLLEVILSSRDYSSFAILWFMVAILAPIFEETLFRGFLLPSLLPQMRPALAMLTSGGLFAVAHLNVADLLPLTVLGIILGYVYWRSGNLWAAILLHGIWNSGSFIGLLLLSP